MIEPMDYAPINKPPKGFLFQSEATAGRVHAADSARGIGILLVVFGHAWRGADKAGLIADGSIFRSIDYAVYAFHMPLFFLLAGLMFLETLQKYDTDTLLRGRVTRLLWPMVLWSWIFFGVKLLAGANANTPVNVSDFPIIPLPPYEHLWFLWALFLAQSSLILAYRFVPLDHRGHMLRWGAGAAAIGIALINPLLSVPSAIVGPVVEHFPYLLAGIALGGLTAYRPSAALAGVAAAVFTGLLLAVGPQKASVIHSLVLVVAAWFAWSFFDKAIAFDNRTMRGLRYLGKVSMVIYLAHTIFSAAVRIALLKVGISDLGVVLTLTVLAGVIGPIAFLWCAQRSRLTKVLGL